MSYVETIPTFFILFDLSRPGDSIPMPKSLIKKVPDPGTLNEDDPLAARGKGLASNLLLSDLPNTGSSPDGGNYIE